MARGAVIGLVLPVILGAIFVAGFFHGDAAPEARPPACKPSPAVMAPYPEVEKRQPPAQKAGAFLSMMAGPGYRRAAQMSLKVDDCAKAEEGLEMKLEEMKGEILDMVMEGTEGSRTCSLSVLVPSDHFRSFISHLRGLGKVRSERITASRLKPGREPAPGRVDHDVRELSHVLIRMADEKVAQNVLQSRSVFSASFDKSASHFMQGAAVMIEGLGYVLPFFLALLALALPFLVAARLRRARTIRITE